MHSLNSGIIKVATVKNAWVIDPEGMGSQGNPKNLWYCLFKVSWTKQHEIYKQWHFYQKLFCLQTFGTRMLGVFAWLMPLSVAISTFGSANGNIPIKFFYSSIYTTIGIVKCTFDVVIVSITTKPYTLQKILNHWICCKCLAW